MDSTVPAEPAQDQELHDLIQWWKTNGRALAWTIILALALCVLVVFLRHNARERRMLAVSSLANARTLTDLENILQDFPRSAVAPMAMLKSAKANFDAGNFAAAQNHYETFLARYKEHDFAPGAELGVAHCLEALNRPADAIRAFEAFVAAHPAHFLAPQAWIGKARCLKDTGRLQEARSTYEDFLVSHPESAWRENVESALKEVNKELAAGDSAAASTEATAAPAAAAATNAPAPIADTAAAAPAPEPAAE